MIDPREFSCTDDRPDNNWWNTEWPEPKEEDIDLENEILEDESNNI